MARARPYIFCRYSFVINEESLDARRQLSALQELHGKLFAYGPTAERVGRYDTLIMRPDRFEVDREKVISWSVGRKTDIRVGVKYDEKKDRLEFITIDDKTVQYSDCVAIPRLGVMAVDDRAAATHLGAKHAINRFCSTFRNIPNGSVNVEFTTTAGEVDRALKTWELAEVTFKIRPYNPFSSSDLSKQMSEAMKREGIGTLRAVARPASGSEMRPVDGPIASAVALSNDGYGQVGVKGVTSDGDVAQIRRPHFENERTKNQKIQAAPRELRVFIEADGDTDEESFKNAVRAMLTFYDQKT